MCLIQKFAFLCIIFYCVLGLVCCQNMDNGTVDNTEDANVTGKI